MKVTLERSAVFVDAINIISELVSEVRIKFRKDGMEILAIDPTNAALLLFKLPASAFSQYELEKDEVLGVSLDDFKQVLRRGRQEEMKLETKDGKLLVNFAGERKRFALSLIELEEEERKEPDLNFAMKVKVDAAKLQEAIEDCAVVSDSVLFAASEKGLVLDAGSSLHTASVHLLNEDFKEKVAARYSIDYLQKMVKAAKLASEATVQFSNDYPIKLEYVSEDDALLSFILAPRVETD